MWHGPHLPASQCAVRAVARGPSASHMCRPTPSAVAAASWRARYKVPCACPTCACAPRAVLVDAGRAGARSGVGGGTRSRLQSGGGHGGAPATRLTSIRPQY
eukprot:5545196-Prymnesium_polylepis.1